VAADPWSGDAWVAGGELRIQRKSRDCDRIGGEGIDLELEWETTGLFIYFVLGQKLRSAQLVPIYSKCVWRLFFCG
jgi:hypothetical protein